MPKPPPQFNPGDAIGDPAFRRKLNEIARQAFRPITGEGVTDHPAHVIIQPRRRGGATVQSGGGGNSFWAKITGTAGAIHSHRWVYNWTRMIGTTGTVAFVESTVTGTALNTLETFNTPGSAVQGNGIDTSSALFDGTGTNCVFKVFEIRGNPVVRMWSDSVIEGTGTAAQAFTVYRFDAPNPVDEA